MFLVLGVPTTRPVAASEAPVDARLEEADRVMRRGDYARAKELADAVLSEARARGEAALEVSARLTLADILY